MSNNVKISVGLVGIALAAMAIAVLLSGNTSDPAPDDAGVLIRPDSQRLSTAPEGSPTFVEFLDFECEACRAVYPAVEALREVYGDRLLFVVRYMPLHYNSEAASRAAEAAADQGHFEDMYHRLFETQPEWGEARISQEHVFFGFAEDMGLDMERFRTVYNDPATIARVQQNEADGRALGVTGTPTFFLEGEVLQVSTIEELIQRIESAIAD